MRIDRRSKKCWKLTVKTASRVILASLTFSKKAFSRPWWSKKYSELQKKNLSKLALSAIFGRIKWTTCVTSSLLLLCRKLGAQLFVFSVGLWTLQAAGGRFDPTATVGRHAASCGRRLLVAVVACVRSRRHLHAAQEVISSTDRANGEGCQRANWLRPAQREVVFNERKRCLLLQQQCQSVLWRDVCSVSTLQKNILLSQKLQDISCSRDFNFLTRRCLCPFFQCNSYLALGIPHVQQCSVFDVRTDYPQRCVRAVHVSSTLFLFELWRNTGRLQISLVSISFLQDLMVLAFDTDNFGTELATHRWVQLLSFVDIGSLSVVAGKPISTAWDQPSNLSTPTRLSFRRNAALWNR